MSKLSEHRTAARWRRSASVKRRGIVPALILGLLSALSLHGQAQQVPAASPANKLGQDPDKAAMFVKLRTEKANEAMEELIAELKKDYSLNDNKVKRLRKAGVKAVDASLDAWAEEFGEFLKFRKRHATPRSSPFSSGMMFNFQFGGVIRRPAASAEAAFVSDFRSPERARPQSQAVWTKTIEETLTAKQLAEWKKENAERVAERNKQIETFLAATGEPITEKEKEKTGVLLMSVKEIIKPDAAQIKQLEALARNTEAAGLKQWRKDARFVLERSAPKAWRGYSRMALPGAPGKSDTWQKGLATLLKPGQKEALKAEVSREKEAETYQLVALVESNVPSVLPGIQQRIKENLNELIKAVEPDELTQKMLSGAADAAVEQSMAAWRAAGLKGLKEMNPKALASVLRNRRYRFGATGDELAPEKQKAWTTALEKLLTPEQKAAWQAAGSVRREEEATRFTEMIEATTASYQSLFESALKPRIEDIILTVNLDESRAKALRGAAEQAAVQSTDAWRKKSVAMLDGLNPNQRAMFLRQGRIPINTGEARNAADQPIWLATVQKVLTPEESTRWNEALRDRESKRRRAIGGVMLAAIEEWVGIEADQWDSLVELCRKETKDLSTRLSAPRFNLQPNQIGQALKRLPEKRVREILTDAQWLRWRAGVTIVERQGAFLPMNIRPPKDAPADSIRISDAANEVIHARNQQQKQRALLLLMAETDIGARAAGLSPEARKRLSTAAKGAAEEVVDKWDAVFSSFVLKRIKGATPKTVYQQLASAGNQGGRLGNPLESPVWKDALRVSLDDAQLKDWKATAQARESRRMEAVADLITVYFEGSLGLGADQTGIFRDKVMTSINTYGPDLAHFFTSRNAKWYLQYFGVGIAVMGIPEAELRSLLTEDQIDIWEFKLRGVAGNNWPRVLQYHRQRMEEEQKEKEESGS